MDMLKTVNDRLIEVANGQIKPDFSLYLEFKKIEAQKRKRITNKFAFGSGLAFIILSLSLTIITLIPAFNLTKPLIIFYLLIGSFYSMPALGRAFELDAKNQEYREKYKYLSKLKVWDKLEQVMDEYRNSTEYESDKAQQIEENQPMARKIADFEIEQAEQQTSLIKKLIKRYKKLGQTKSYEEILNEVKEQQDLL